MPSRWVNRRCSKEPPWKPFVDSSGRPGVGRPNIIIAPSDRPGLDHSNMIIEITCPCCVGWHVLSKVDERFQPQHLPEVAVQRKDLTNGTRGWHEDVVEVVLSKTPHKTSMESLGFRLEEFTRPPTSLNASSWSQHSDFVEPSRCWTDSNNHKPDYSSYQINI